MSCKLDNETLFIRQLVELRPYLSMHIPVINLVQGKNMAPSIQASAFVFLNKSFKQMLRSMITMKNKFS